MRTFMHAFVEIERRANAAQISLEEIDEKLKADPKFRDWWRLREIERKRFISCQKF